MTRIWPAVFTVVVATSILVVVAGLSRELPPHARQPLTTLVQDDYELAVFYNRTDFVRRGELPYVGETIAYPLLGVVYVMLPRLFGTDFADYRTGLVLQNVIVTVLLMLVTARLLRQLGRPRHWLWLLALPGFLYFALYRYDVFPALLVVVAFLCLFSRRYGPAFITLGIAVLAKGYPIVLFPIMFAYCGQEKGQYPNPLFNRYVFMTLAPSAVVLAAMSWAAGIEKALFPYLFQTSRQIDHGTIYLWYAEWFRQHLTRPTWNLLNMVFLKMLALLQVVLPLSIYLGHRYFSRLIRYPRDVVVWSVLTLLLFIQFFPYHSPQWFIWILPLLVLVIETRAQLAVVISYGLVTYLQFPVAFNYFGYDSLVHGGIVMLRTTLHLSLFVLLAREFISGQRRDRGMLSAYHQESPR
ncbi:MAG: DUF2029 domain-containing protein [Candidatus Kerfeldbacteria bacterium]|nr:DUF2029 domain-containing protein [Candidatus Kerfeldbacteria bacterium]